MAERRGKREAAREEVITMLGTMEEEEIKELLGLVAGPKKAKKSVGEKGSKKEVDEEPKEEKKRVRKPKEEVRLLLFTNRRRSKVDSSCRLKNND